MPIPRSRLRLTDDEFDELLSTARQLHVATVSVDGRPHVVPLWFVWRDGAVWVHSMVKSRRGRNLREESSVSVCVDAGIEYGELRGAVIEGRFVDAAGTAGFDGARRAFAEKYWGGADVPPVRSHVWLRFVADRVTSWDFRKIPAGRDVRSAARPGGEAEARPSS